MSEFLIMLLVLIGGVVLMMWAFNPVLAASIIEVMSILFILLLVVYIVRMFLRYRH